MIPYSRQNLADFYTLSQTKLFENHILHSGSYLYSSYIYGSAPPPGGTPPPPGGHLARGFTFYPLQYIYSYFEKGCRKKSIKVHATRPKGVLGIHWNFAYWPRGNLQVCIFARGEFVFPLRRPISVALLLLLQDFE